MCRRECSGIVLTFWQGKYGEIVSGKDEDLHLPSRFEPKLIAFLMITIGASHGRPLIGQWLIINY